MLTAMQLKLCHVCWCSREVGGSLVPLGCVSSHYCLIGEFQANEWSCLNGSGWCFRRWHPSCPQASIPTHMHTHTHINITKYMHMHTHVWCFVSLFPPHNILLIHWEFHIMYPDHNTYPVLPSIPLGTILMRVACTPIWGFGGDVQAITASMVHCRHGLCRCLWFPVTTKARQRPKACVTAAVTAAAAATTVAATDAASGTILF